MSKPYRARRAIALLRYYLRTIWRRSAVFSWLVLAVALYVALAVVFPPFQLPLRAIGLELPSLTRYEISGIVHQVGSNQPLAAVRVSVGGYSSTTDSSGHYRFDFSSSSSQHIAVVMDGGSANAVYFVNAGPDDTILLDGEVQ